MSIKFLHTDSFYMIQSYYKEKVIWFILPVFILSYKIAYLSLTGEPWGRLWKNLADLQKVYPW
jgi:hypothetical protein